MSVYRSLRSQNLAVTNRSSQQVRSCPIWSSRSWCQSGVALDDRLVEAHGQVGTVECAQCRVVGLRAALALSECRDLNVVLGVPRSLGR